MPGERAQVIGSITLWGTPGYVIFRDFELYSDVAKRRSQQVAAGLQPTDLSGFVEGIQVYEPNCSFINLIVHDSVRSGFYTSADANNTVIHGCIVYNTGWVSPDNAEGHSFYLQGTGEFSDNIGFNSAGAIFHVYANGPDFILHDVTLDGNVAFGAGAIQNVRPYRDWIIGVDAPASEANRIILRSNMGYIVTNSMTLSQVQLGRDNLNGSVVAVSNYWPQGIVLTKWQAATVVGNLIAPQDSSCAVEVYQDLTNLTAWWNNNSYYIPRRTRGRFRLGSNLYAYGDWKNITRFDANSLCSGQELRGTQVFVRPNRYEKGRANIVVYNWDNMETVAVDVSSVLPLGASYEVRNAQDFFSAPLLSGIYSGEQLTLPMNGLSVAEPWGGLSAARPTGPTFNVFVLLPTAPINSAALSTKP
jgi:hypothetical protein